MRRQDVHRSSHKAGMDQGRYRSRVDGNLARSDNYEIPAKPREDGQRERETVQKSETQERQAPRFRAREKQKVSFSTLLLSAAVIVLLVMIVRSYASLTEISTEVVALQKELEVIEEEHVSLRTQYERTYDISTIEETAKEYGMSRPGSTQIQYLDLSQSNDVTVYSTAGAGPLGDLFAALKNGILAVVEFFS